MISVMEEAIVVDSRGGPLVRIRVKPRSSRPGVTRGEGVLIVSVRAPAEAGKATEEALRSVAEVLGFSRSAISLKTGATSRQKHVVVTGWTAADLQKRIDERLPG